MKTLWLYFLIIIFLFLCSTNMVISQNKDSSNKSVQETLNPFPGPPERFLGNLSLNKYGLRFQGLTVKSIENLIERIVDDSLNIASKDIKKVRIELESTDWDIQYVQTCKNIPIEGSDISTDIDSSGWFFLFLARTYPRIECNLDSSFAAEKAIALAKNQAQLSTGNDLRYGEHDRIPCELVILPVQHDSSNIEYQLVWKVGPIHSDFYYIDASNGKILRKEGLPELYKSYDLFFAFGKQFYC